MTDGEPGSRVPARLKKRPEFQAAGRGVRVHAAPFTLQANRRKPADDAAPPVTQARIGLTVTRKVGNAPERNRIRRRLREALRLAKALSTDPATDYVIVARRDVLGLPFTRLTGEIEAALGRIGGKLNGARGGGGSGRRANPR